MSIETEQLLTKTIMIPTKKILDTKDINSYIEFYLKNTLEDRCDNNSYIISDSLELINRSIGLIKTIDRVNNIQYEITYKVKTITPSIGDILESKISSITKMGILSYLVYKDSSVDNSPILFIIPKEYFGEKFSRFKVGDILKTKILNIRIRFRCNQIQVVSEPILV